MTSEVQGIAIAIFGTISLFGCYFMPAIIATARHHRNTAAIWILNTFLGITVVGWFVALVWAMTDNSRS